MAVGKRTSTRIAANKKAPKRVTPASSAPKQSLVASNKSVGPARASPRNKQKAGETGSVARDPVLEKWNSLPDILNLPAEEWQFTLEWEYRLYRNEALLVNFGAAKDTSHIQGLPVYPTMETHTIQDWKNLDKVLTVPDGFLVYTRGDLLALPVTQIGKFLKDYGLHTPSDKDEWIDILLKHLGAPTRADAATIDYGYGNNM